MKFTKKWLPVALVLFGLNAVFAQTWTQTSAPSNTWTSVASSADGNRLFATSFGWKYYLSTNSGTTWTTNTQPQSGSTYGGWSCTASSADGSILVGALGDVIWVSTNSGASWSSNTVPHPSFYFYGGVALSADGNKLAAVVGFNSTPGPIFTSSDSGVTLTQTGAPTNNWVSVACSADGTKLVAAAMDAQAQCGFIYTSTNSGLTWALTGAPTNNAWSTVASSADGTKLVAASWYAYVSNHIYGCVYTSTNSGLTWTSNNVADAQWESVASSADGSTLVAASVGPNNLICTSTNSGTTWVSNSIPNGGTSSVASSADGSKLVAAGFFGGIYTFQTTPKPQLSLETSDGIIKLSWLVPSTNFVMQQNLDLTSSNWTEVTNTPVLDLTNLQEVAMLPVSADSGFYRLKSP